jgi:hypothetical protein
MSIEPPPDGDARASGRLGQVVLIAATLSLSWLGMQVVHESGHVLAAWAGGETVHRVVLRPLAISRTDATRDRRPLLVAWGGAAVGATLPLGMFALARALRWNRSHLLRFLAGFCLVANGAYLGVGAFNGDGDAGDLLRFGAPRWSLFAFGLTATPAGLALWHGLGPRFGLGPARGRVDPGDVRWTLGLLAVLLAAELIADGR